MKTLIFDLDGTLWNTEDSYYYAFKKFLKLHPSKASQMSESLIDSFRGLTMDKIAPLLFPNEPKEEQVNNIIECMEYTFEYLKSKDVNEELINSIITLSQNYQLFIVSNCPNQYVDIFFEKTKLRKYFKDVISLGGFEKNSIFDKANNIKNLIDKYQLSITETYFVGDTYLDLDASRYANVKFIYVTSEMNLLKTINQKMENYQILDLCDYYKEYLYKDANAILMQNNNQKEYKFIFGFLTLSKDLNTNKKVFDEMLIDAKALGATSIVGPVNYCSWFDYRLPIDHYDTQFIPDIPGKKEDIEMLRALGFKEVYTYASTLANINKSLEYISNKVKLSNDYYDELIVGEKAFEYTREIFDISSKAFIEGYLYSNVPFEVFNNIYMKWLKKLPFDIDLYMIRQSSSKELVAYGICYFDKINNMYVCKTAAILKEHQKTSVVMKLVDVVFKRARHHNATQILYHFQNEQKNTLSAFWRNHIIVKKRYALFIKEAKNESM